MRQIAIYGKGGIGKSTIASNVSASFSLQGKCVMQVGCDPKRDSTRNLVGGQLIPTVLDVLREKIAEGNTEQDISLEEIVFPGFNGVYCVESGGPEPGVGCAGRGVLTAITILTKLHAHTVYNPDIVIYDVLGDVVCGGFAQPIREGFAQEVYLVCSGEFMSLYAANNICKAIEKHARRGNSRLAGIIYNARGDPEKELPYVKEFATQLNSTVVGMVPRDMTVQKSETQGKTVAEAYPDSSMMQVFKDLAHKIWENDLRTIPTPLSVSTIETLVFQHVSTL
ncbi:MAG: nitrogenase iron protein [Theionarchaea archaeon]|nr:nitrogenase iron protein [Theionarchaea archaeon]